MATENETGWILISAANAPHGGAEGVPGVDRVKLTRKEIGSSRLSTGVTSFEPGAGLYWHMHHVEESVTVIEGELICEVGGVHRPIESQRVGLFDTTFISASTPHRFYNPTTSLARILWSYPDGHVERIRVNPDGTIPAASNPPVSKETIMNRSQKMGKTQTRIAPAELECWLRSALEKVSMTSAEAGVTAHVLAEADLRGVFSHGVVRLPDYSQLVEDSSWETGAELKQLAHSGATALLDGGNGIGPYQAMRAMEVAIEIAKANGIGWVWLRHAGHFGPAGAYTMRATQEGFIGIALTNSSPAMAAVGGWRAVLGANPWSIAIPRGSGKWPLVLDIANTIVARGRIKNAASRGEILPADWALDSDGKPTTDPAEAVNGSLFPFGGHKGYAIAFMMEALTAAIAGSAMAVEVQAPIPGTKGHQGVGQMFAAINPVVAISEDEMEARLDQLIAYMRSSGDGESAQQILVPGEREARVVEEQTRLGIALPNEVRAKVAKWAEHMGLPLPAGCKPDQGEHA